jgi:predicted Fe-Mo cluster-binding NifX family protein
MRIAVATDDGVSISQHFGRSAGFIIFEVEGTQVSNLEMRANRHTPHAQGLCQGQHPHQQGHNHSHGGIVGLLRDCQAVLCGGMGAGAAQALRQQGIKPIVLACPISAEDAVSLYLSGRMETAPSNFCEHV